MGWIIEVGEDTLGPVDYDEAREIVRANPTARVRGEGDRVWMLGTEALFGEQRTGEPAVVVNDHLRRVIVTDIDMPFFSMVSFILRWTLASIPAAIILAIVGGMLWSSFWTMMHSR